MRTEADARNTHHALPERLRSLLACAEDGVWVTGADGQIVFWNRAAETTLGYRAREVVGRRCADVLAEAGAARRPLCGGRCHGGGALLADAGADESFTGQTYAKSGRPLWLDVTALATDASSGAGPFVVHVFHDVTRTRELLRDLHERLSQTPPDAVRLTPRELEILGLMAEGLGTAAAAERLRLSRATIRNHVQNIFAKLGVHTRVEAVVHATRRRLV
jgi:PAS domain S-box-containing protein